MRCPHCGAQTVSDARFVALRVLQVFDIVHDVATAIRVCGVDKTKANREYLSMIRTIMESEDGVDKLRALVTDPKPRGIRALYASIPKRFAHAKKGKTDP